MNDKFKNDKLQFELIRNSDLVCKDCLYKYDDTNIPGNVSKCEMYEEKPSIVIDGGNCDLYAKRVKTNRVKFKARSPLKAQFPNRYKIICKDCAFRDKSTITIHGKVIPVGVTKAFCDKYRNPPQSNGKPHDVLFNEAICEYYEEEKL